MLPQARGRQTLLQAARRQEVNMLVSKMASGGQTGVDRGATAAEGVAVNLEQRAKRMDSIQHYIQNDFKAPHITYKNPSVIRIFCPYCGEEYSGDKSFLCKQALCKKCSRRFIVGQSPETGGLNIPSNIMTINESMLVANGCKLMGNLQAARQMTAETAASHPGWIPGHYFLACADILLQEYDEAAKSLFTYIERSGCKARQDLDNYNYMVCIQCPVLAGPDFGRELQIGPFLLPKNYYYNMLFNDNGEIDCGDNLVQLLLDCVFISSFKDVFECLGHCYIRRHPEKFWKYPYLFDAAAKFESEILNNKPKDPPSYHWELSYISCTTGLSYALSNIAKYETDEEALKASKPRIIFDCSFFGGKNVRYGGEK